MKKELLLIAAAAAMFAACERNDFLREPYSSPESENDSTILFNSFADNVTKGTAENSEALYTWTFYNHQETFKVWGRKAGQATHEIFDGTTVTVAPATAPATGYTYTYSPARFWDKSAASYHFYAAAPADDSWTFNGGSTIITDDASLGAGYFTTTATLNGVNLQSTNNGGASDALKNIFKGATLANGTTKDIDKLIAAPCEVTKSYYNRATPQAVNLNFIHILSKLNVTISTSLYDADHNYDVDLLAFEIHNMPNAGAFNESTAIPNTKKAIRWTLNDPGTTTKILTGIDDSSNKIDITLPTAAEAAARKPGAKKYIVESLIIPQAIKYERVALDSLAHDAIADNAVYYTDWKDYTQSMPIEALTKAQFDSLYVIDGETYTVKTLAQYQALEGKGGTTQEQFNTLLDKITKTKAVNIPAYNVPSEPFFTIKYSIDGDIFTQNFNLAAAFLGYTNNSQKKDGNGDLIDLAGGDDTTFPFYEGWQNTLNIIINPTAIEFTADVAEWSDNIEKEYEIERGNENPNN